MIAEIKADAEDRMKKAVDATSHEFSKIRTGKATTALLDGIRVEYYGTKVPLNQAANLAVPEPRLITVQPWEKSMAPEIVKEIQKSDLGLNPIQDGGLIRIPIPPLNEERRKDLVRLCKKLAEEGRVAIRNVRRDANERLKKAEKDKQISEDEHHRTADEIQKLTDEYVAEIDKLVAAKEAEVMEV
ncbi:MAG: ribosome recycling factor [Candidatus Zixiibacteriota bacterium]